MKKLFFLLFISITFYGCHKCGECYVMEYEADGVTLKQETDLGQYCGSDGKQKAEEKAVADGITCKICHVECR